MTLKIEPTRGSYFKITLNGETICECMTRPQAQEKFEFLAMVYDAGYDQGLVDSETDESWGEQV